MRLIVIICLLLVYALPAIAQEFEYNSRCQQAYQEILALKLDNGRLLLAAEKEQQPNNYMVYLVEDYVDLFQIFVQEEEEVFNRLAGNKDKRLDKIAKGDANSPYYLYAQAEINLHWAFARLKFEQYYKAFWEVRKAYKLLKTNQRKFPDFKLNQKSLGLIHALVGTIPDNYMWGVKILGLNGDVKQGIGELENFLEYSRKNDQVFYDEAIAMYTFLLIYLDNQPEKAWELASSFSTNQHLLNTFIASDIAIRTGRSSQAISLLENRPSSSEFIDFYFLDYLLGALKLNKLDKNASTHLRQFTRHFKGKHYLKDAYQKLAWHSLLFDGGKQYGEYMSLCKSKGATLVDADKQALKNAKNPQRPHKGLLKARLLFDGGHYTKAMSAMEEIDTEKITILELQEHSYRLGRIYERLGKSEEALYFYGQAILSVDEGEIETYYAPKSCLQMGLIYEASGHRTAAREYYEQCFKYSGYEYENSIEQQAKAGLSRTK